MEGITILALIIAATWIITFIKNPELRTEMITLGIFALFLVPITFQAPIYTSLFTNISIQEIILLFTSASLAGIIFHLLSGKHYHKLPTPKKSQNPKAEYWILRLLFLFIAFSWITILLQAFLQLSIANATLLSAIALAIYVTSHRHDLLANTLWSAALTGFSAYIALTVTSLISTSAIGTSLANTSTYIAGIPIDIITWSIAIGLFLGPVYEFARHKKVC